MYDSRLHKIGNAQTIGRRDIESNYFSTVYNDAGDLFAVLADGAIDHPNGRWAAVIAVQYCADAFLRKFSHDNLGQIMHETAVGAAKRIDDVVFLGMRPYVSLAMIVLINKSLWYFNVGANNIYLYNGRNERLLSDASNSPYTYGRCELAPKNAVCLLSEGAHSVTHSMERLNIFASGMEAFYKSQAIIEKVNSKGLTNQSNATAILIEVVK
jgi:hypothetical protein